MTTIEIYENGKKAEIPSSWAEIPAKTVRKLFRIHYDVLKSSKGSLLEFNVRALYLLLGIRPSLKVMLHPGNAPENIYRLCEQTLGFLFIEDGDKARLSFNDVRNPMPRVGRLHGPTDLLQDLTFGEFRQAAMSLQRFFHGYDITDLDDCIAVLYRRRAGKTNRAGRRVAPMGSRGFFADRRSVERMAPWRKNLIMMWFSACLKYLQTRKLVLNGEEVDMTALFSDSKGEKSSTPYTWNDLLVQVARDQTIGNMERVDEEPLFSILAIMWSNFKEAKRNEKAAKTHQRK